MRRHPESPQGRCTIARALGTAVVVQVLACVPLPLATPPGRVSLAASAPLAWHARADAARSTRRPALGPALELRAAIEPLQLVPALSTRRHELGLGYLLRYPDPWVHAEPRHGVFVEMGQYFWMHRLSEGRVRLGALASVDLLLPLHGLERGAGGGGSLSLVADWSHHLDEGTAVVEGSPDGAFMGWTWGEVGVGLIAGGAWQHTARDDVWTLCAGLQLRMPAMIGVALVPLTEFL